MYYPTAQIVYCTVLGCPKSPISLQKVCPQTRVCGWVILYCTVLCVQNHLLFAEVATLGESVQLGNTNSALHSIVLSKITYFLHGWVIVYCTAFCSSESLIVYIRCGHKQDCAVG